MNKLLISILFIIGSFQAHACLWDDDTLAQESEGLPEVKAVIAGGFVRNPPLYYEMRIERLEQVLKNNPDDLDAYDGIAVANDRLGKSSKAIKWMAKKKEALDRLKYDTSKHKQPNHMYRYYANLGTFYAHKWIKSKDKQNDLSDMKQAEKYVEKAIKDNPDAHFGREKYQLKAIKWIIKLYDDKKGFEELPNMLEITREMLYRRSDNDNLKEAGLEDSIDGLCGLIIMGAAWESVDIYYALSLALQADGKSSVAIIALERCNDLINNGRGSIVPKSPIGEKLKERIKYESRLQDPKPVVDEYYSLRQQAKAWHDKRTNYLLTKLKKGEHPDTNPEFWNKFDGDHKRPELQVNNILSYKDRLNQKFDYARMICIFTAIILITLALFFHFYKKRQKSKA